MDTIGTKFSPENVVVRLCMGGLGLEDEGKVDEALGTFQRAWDEATDDFERFIAAYHVARLQEDLTDRLRWLETSLQSALSVDDGNLKSACATLYAHLAECYEDLGDSQNASRNRHLARMHNGSPTDEGPFYHGTKADLQMGDLLVPGGQSNYQPGLTMNHIYFTANLKGAVLAAALAQGQGRERVYVVEPTGEFEDDPNVTDKKFPGNLTRSYRSNEPLRIIGEETDWESLSNEERGKWKKNVEKRKGEIIN